jgi:hypothetical protein
MLMNLSQTVALAILILALGAGLTALAALCRLVFPRLVARARRNAERMPVRAFLVGLVNFAFFGLIATALASGDEGSRVLGLLVATALFSFVAIGFAAVAQLLGERLRPDDTPLRQVVAGGALLELASLVPLVGWFAVPALALLTGYGAVIVAIVRREKDQDPRHETRDLRHET